MKDYKAIIFDLDGTLLDTLADLAASTNHALQKMNYPARSLSEVRQFVGNGVAKLVERAVPIGTTPEKVEKALAIFKSHYAEHCEDNTAPYEGILTLLDNLLAHGKILAVVSNKIDSAVSVLCQKYFGDRFALSVGDRENIRKKPAPDSVFEVLSHLGLEKDEVIYVGDSEVDIETAKNAEMDCISVTWGFRDPQCLMKAWGVCDAKNTHPYPVFCEKSRKMIAAYFANTVQEVENILLAD